MHVREAENLTLLRTARQPPRRCSLPCARTRHG
jgi:hypothetical protein